MTEIEEKREYYSILKSEMTTSTVNITTEESTAAANSRNVSEKQETCTCNFYPPAVTYLLIEFSVHN